MADDDGEFGAGVDIGPGGRYWRERASYWRHQVGRNQSAIAAAHGLLQDLAAEGLLADRDAHVLEAVSVAFRPAEHDQALSVGHSRVNGVARDTNYARCLIVYLDQQCSDDDMRRLHEVLREHFNPTATRGTTQ